MARPPGITDRLDNGQTVAERIIQSIGAGNYFEQASDAAGVGRRTTLRWLRDGALISKRIAAGEDPKLTDNEQAYYEFWRGVTAADARWEVTALTQLEVLARGATQNPETGQWQGPSKTTITTKRDKTGEVIETTTRTEHLPPDAAVIMWRLERKHPDRFGKRVELVGASVPDPLTRDDKVESIGDTFERYLAAQDEADDHDAVDQV
jgi:hypothetical protein